MDPRQFDVLAISLSLRSRRAIVGGAGALALLVAGKAPFQLDAKRKKKRKKKKGGKGNNVTPRTLGQSCSNSQPCATHLDCCNGTCKRALGDLACTPNIEGKDSTCCTGYCTEDSGCCKGPGQACATSECCPGLACDAGTCKAGCPLVNGEPCCNPSTTNGEACCVVETTNGDTCCNPLSIRGETCCPAGRGTNAYFCGHFRCLAYLTETGPGGCDLWCRAGHEGSLCGPGVDGIPTGEGNGRACCCTQPGTSICLWPE